jgi:hypothetical protein
MKITDVTLDKIAQKLIKEEVLEIYEFGNCSKEVLLITLGRISAIIDLADETKKAMQENLKECETK